MSLGRSVAVRRGLTAPLVAVECPPHSYPGRYTPSPEEIARQCRAIRRGWDPLTRERRTVGPGREEWSVPTVDLSELRDVV